MLIKLQLSKNFPKKLLYVRKVFLGIGLLYPKIVLVILAMKLYLGYRRVRKNVINMIEMSKEYIESLRSFSNRWHEVESKYKY